MNNNNENKENTAAQFNLTKFKIKYFAILSFIWVSILGVIWYSLFIDETMKSISLIGLGGIIYALSLLRCLEMLKKFEKGEEDIKDLENVVIEDPLDILRKPPSADIPLGVIAESWSSHSPVIDRLLEDEKERDQLIKENLTRGYRNLRIGRELSQEELEKLDKGRNRIVENQKKMDEVDRNKTYDFKPFMGKIPPNQLKNHPNPYEHMAKAYSQEELEKHSVNHTPSGKKKKLSKEEKSEIQRVAALKRWAKRRRVERLRLEQPEKLSSPNTIKKQNKKKKKGK